MRIIRTSHPVPARPRITEFRQDEGSAAAVPAAPRRRLSLHWQDVLVALLGVWLFISPWIVARPIAHRAGTVPVANPLIARIALALHGATWLDWIVGALLVLAMAVTLWRHGWVGRWAAVALGAVAFATPWIFRLIGPGNVATPPGPVMSGFAVMFLVLPGAGGLVWSNWLTGAAACLLSLWSALTRARRRAAVRSPER